MGYNLRRDKANMNHNGSRKETSADRLVYFAAERTLLAWVRAGLSLMALGFVVDRFELFVRHLVPVSSAPVRQHFFSDWIGVTLVCLGVIASAVAALRYWRFDVSYHRESETRPGRGIALGVFLSLGTAGLGIVTVVLLVLTVS
jgi:putative membrane protein